MANAYPTLALVCDGCAVYWTNYHTGAYVSTVVSAGATVAQRYGSQIINYLMRTIPSMHRVNINVVTLTANAIYSFLSKEGNYIQKPL